MIADEFAPAVHAFVEVVEEEDPRKWIVAAHAWIGADQRSAKFVSR
jgi:hypothetical protein